MQKGYILSIDDDKDLQMVVGTYLQDDGYHVISAQNAADAVQALTNQPAGQPFDIILLDLVLPDAEGLSLIPQFRSKSDAGIIVVSGKSDTTEKIICLEMGADDYLTKPFEMRELSARIKAVLRRMDAPPSREPQHAPAPQTTQTSSDNPSATADMPAATPANHGTPVAFAGFTLDPAQYQVFDQSGASLDFTTGEFQLLQALIASPNRALSREQLFDMTRDGEFDAYDRAIDIQIARIRKKLNDNQNTIIRTVRGIGYMYSKSA